VLANFNSGEFGRIKTIPMPIYRHRQSGGKKNTLPRTAQLPKIAGTRLEK
jgi:hypothetical protein